jgi:hypothetical protein
VAPSACAAAFYQLCGEVMAEEYVVAQHQCHRILADELRAQGECLSQAVG